MDVLLAHFGSSARTEKVIQITPAFCTKLSTEKVNKIDLFLGHCL